MVGVSRQAVSKWEEGAVKPQHGEYHTSGGDSSGIR
ncbi:MAG: hypothetical protein ACLR71_10480 [[Clostridium] scindens]